MDTVENPHKGCLYEEHNNKHISFICMDGKCQAKSRTACQQCMIKNYHSDCKQFLIFDSSNREDPNFKIEYSEDHKLYDLCQEIYTKGEDIIKQIDKKLDELLNEVTEKINKLRKETKVKQQENMKNAKEMFKDFIDKQKVYHDFSELNQVMNKYRESQIGIEQLNKSLIEKQKQYSFQENDEIELQQKFEQLQFRGQCININKDQLQKAQKQIIYEIETYDLFQNVIKYFAKIQFNQINYIIINNFQNYKREKIRKLKPIDGCEVGCEQKANNIYVGKRNDQQQFPNFMSMRSFKRKEQISFRFKILSLDNCNDFCLGITSQDLAQQKKFWFSYGNQIGYYKENDWRSEFNKRGNKSINEVFRVGQIFTMEVCVQDNMMVIRDENSECIMESQKLMEQDIDDWVVVLGNNHYDYGYSIQVL